MSRFIRSELAKTASRIVLVASAAALVVGCSSDMSRFNGEPDAGPFRTSQRFDQGSSGFGSSAPQQVAAAPVSSVQSAPLAAPVQSSPLAPAPNYTPPPARAASAPLQQPTRVATAQSAPAPAKSASAVPAQKAAPAAAAAAPMAAKTETKVARTEPAQKAPPAEI